MNRLQSRIGSRPYMPVENLTPAERYAAGNLKLKKLVDIVDLSHNGDDWAVQYTDKGKRLMQSMEKWLQQQ